MNEHIPEREQELRERVVRIETELESMTLTREKAQEADATVKALEQRVKRLEDSHMWLWRAVAGAIATGLITWLATTLARG
ncbi:hemolysin XhlA family protein [Alicyclobacillus fastidiosus]|uniref:Hemolysin XhlA family protein n=1 Tax=Alicyclobacillus fastidiosus TaxID=392011 RepID=A0ABY6ZGC7_9BACL|nr:hemolysin XhlA family protein [Alicyclobacillus fastidiosus]WAH41141.1 hemolysin XhlA family protein [Alicyclobacillus fastidiosus]GMA62703.1 phage protein [Alicyclobacillus fastidiosus]